MKLVEAMSFGIPVVISAVGGMTELTAGKDVSVIVKPENPKALARGIGIILESKGVANTISRNSKILFEKNLRWDVVKDDIRDIIEKL